nr:MAG TPA: hypothetical protein [Caudoviricetes sp.]
MVARCRPLQMRSPIRCWRPEAGVRAWRAARSFLGF